MNCNTCIIGISFLFSSIFSAYMGHNKKIFLEFNQLLNANQKRIYINIIQERLKIYSIALVSGLASGLLYLSQLNTISLINKRYPCLSM